jgi:hypothetical protein
MNSDRPDSTAVTANPRKPTNIAPSTRSRGMADEFANRQGSAYEIVNRLEALRVLRGVW